MARRGRPPAAGGLKTARQALSKERARLAGELAKIDRALAALGGGGPGRPRGKRRGRKPGPKPGRRPGRPAMKRGPGRPPKKRGPGRPPKAVVQAEGMA